MSGESLKPCPLCGNDSWRHAFDALDFDTSSRTYALRQCGQCGLVVIEPWPTAEELQACYSDAYYGAGEEKFTGPLEWATRLAGRLRARSILRRLGPRPQEAGTIRVLDIGCGRANLLREFRALGCECHGVERADFPGLAEREDVQFHEDLDGFESASFDVIVLWHALEHLEAPFETLDRVVELLRPAGHLVVSVPNFASHQARWFGAHWFHLDLPRHLYHFGPQNLAGALRKRGLEIRRIATLSWEQNPYGFIQSALNASGIGPPNGLYQALKQGGRRRDPGLLLAWAAACVVLVPLALLETMLSAAAGAGASAIVTAARPASRDSSPTP